MYVVIAFCSQHSAFLLVPPSTLSSMMTEKQPGLLKRMFPSLSGVGKYSISSSGGDGEGDAPFDGVATGGITVGGGGDEVDDDSSCPSYKSVAINSSTAANHFFDSGQKKMVEIDNFSFDQAVNHFETRSTDSSLALLDPGCLESGRDSIDRIEDVSKAPEVFIFQ